MMKLAVIVLGNSRSGKSTTWNTLFGRTVRTGQKMRKLKLPNGYKLSVFLVSGSPEERKQYVGDIVRTAPPVVLCSLQYTEGARESVQFFRENGYSLYVQWLNAGYSDKAVSPDSLGFLPFLLFDQATVTIRDGREKPGRRVDEIREFLVGWTSRRQSGRNRI